MLAELISLDAARARGMQGGSTPDPRVEEAMDAANGSFVPMDDLQKVRTFRSSSAPCIACHAAPRGPDTIDLRSALALRRKWARLWPTSSAARWRSSPLAAQVR